MSQYDGLERVIEHGSVTLYAALAVLGAVLGGRLVAKDSAAWPLAPRERRLVMLATLGGGAIGALIPAFFAGDFVQWRADLHLIGPKTILGSLLAGFFSVAVFKRLAGIAYDTSDAFVRGTALMMGIGRVGCFFGHCCIGRRSPAWMGIDLGDGVPRFPIQLVEAALTFALFLLFDRWHRENRFPGRRLFLFFLLYGVTRFIVELGREPIARIALGIGFYQWLALALAGVGLYQVWKRGDHEHPFRLRGTFSRAR